MAGGASGSFLLSSVDVALGRSGAGSSQCGAGNEHGQPSFH
jgi:hypothetical protein